MDDAESTLSVGQLKKPLLTMLHGCDDDLQFEWKEYLICIERDAVPNHQGTESTVPVQPSVKEVASYSKAKTTKTGDPLLRPKNLEVKTFSGCIDVVLSAISNVLSGGGREDVMDRGEGFGKKRLAITSEMDDGLSVLGSRDDSCVLSKKVKQTISTFNPPTPSSGNTDLSETISNRPMPQASIPSESRFVLPPFQSIQQHDYSFYSLNPFPPPSSLSEYQQQLTLIAEAVIRSFLFATSSKYPWILGLFCRIFAQYTKQGNQPLPTDVLPPLSWLQRSSIKGVLKWEGCSVKVTKKAERTFLSIPSYSSSDLKANEESGSLYNHLFVLLAKSEVFFARSLWHGCTADQIIEITPFRCAFQSLSSILVIDYGSVRKKKWIAM